MRQKAKLTTAVLDLVAAADTTHAVRTNDDPGTPEYRAYEAGIEQYRMARAEAAATWRYEQELRRPR